MSKTRPTRYLKPDLMVLLTFFVGFGVILTSFVQAAEPAQSASILERSPAGAKFRVEQRAPSLWGLDLAAKLKTWKPTIAFEVSEDGLHLSRPFGARGPVLQFSTTVPEHAASSLKAGGDHRIGLSNDTPDAYLFLERNW